MILCNLAENRNWFRKIKPLTTYYNYDRPVLVFCLLWMRLSVWLVTNPQLDVRLQKKNWKVPVLRAIHCPARNLHRWQMFLSSFFSALQEVKYSVNISMVGTMVGTMTHGSLTSEAPWTAVETGPMSFTFCLSTPSYSEYPSSGCMFSFYTHSSKERKEVA